MALPDLITVEELFSPPERAAASISPDGKRIAYLAPWRNRLNVWVTDIEASAATGESPTSTPNHAA